MKKNLERIFSDFLYHVLSSAELQRRCGLIGSRWDKLGSESFPLLGLLKCI